MVHHLFLTPTLNKIRFRGCPIRDKSKKCGVYGFLDLELPSDYYKGLVYSLHEENKALKRMNRMPVGVMDGTSGVVSNNSFGEKHLKSEFTFIKSKFKIYDRILILHAVFTYFSVDQYGQRQRQSTRLIRMYGYQSTYEYYVDYDYWNTWVQDESTDEEDEDEVMTTKDEVMTTKDDDLLFYQDTFPVDKFVPFGKAMG
ncbi:hypothetical protein Tco_0663098 [Tanacetum coccineum]